MKTHPQSTGVVGSSLSKDRLCELREAFDLFDMDKAGFIDARELKAAMRALGFEVKVEHVCSMLTQANEDDEEKNILSNRSKAKDGEEPEQLLHMRVTFDQFVRVMTAELARRDTREEIWKIYKLFDTDRKGYVNQHDLEKVCIELGEDVTPAKIEEMIKIGDSKGKFGGKGMDFQDFYKVMKVRSSENIIDQFSSDEDDQLRDQQGSA